MDFRRASPLHTRLAAMVLVYLVAFSLYGLYCVNTVSEVKINGPYYQRIVQGKDVIADILPPPQYLLETHLTAYRMLDADTGPDLAALTAVLARLKGEYLERHRHWERELPEDSLKTALVRDSYAPGLRMLEALEGEFLPALHSGNREQARTVLDLVVHREYAAHRAAIDRTVQLALARNREDEARAAVAVQSRVFGQISLGIFLFFILSFLAAWMLQKTDEPGARSPSPGGTDPTAGDGREPRPISGRGQIRSDR